MIGHQQKEETPSAPSFLSLIYFNCLAWLLPAMHNDETIWACLGEGFCSFKVRWKTPPQDFCSSLLIRRPFQENIVEDMLFFDVCHESEKMNWLHHNHIIYCIYFIYTYILSIYTLELLCADITMIPQLPATEAGTNTTWQVFATKTHVRWQTVSMLPLLRKKASTTSTWKQWKELTHPNTCGKGQLGHSTTLMFYFEPSFKAQSVLMTFDDSFIHLRVHLGSGEIVQELPASVGADQ